MCLPHGLGLEMLAGAGFFLLLNRVKFWDLQGLLCRTVSWRNDFLESLC